MITAVLFFGYTVLSVAGLTLLKITAPGLRAALTGGQHVDWPLVGQFGLGAFLYLAAFGIWLAILARLDVSVAYPVAIGLTLVFLSLASTVVLKESLGLDQISGMALIFAGIMLLSRSGA